MKKFFTKSSEFSIVGWAESGDSAIRKVQETRPDLVLMDIFMPGMNGLEATREIKKLSKPPRVIMVSVFENAEYERASVAVGADGFISKTELAVEGLIDLEKLFGTKQPAK